MASDEQTLVLIHGLLDDGAMWDVQAQHLSPYAQVVTPNILNQESVSDAAKSILDEVEGDFAVAGFSMGGYIVFELLRQARERITKVALIDTGARSDTAEKTQERKKSMTLAESGRYEQLVDEALPNVIHPSRVDDTPLMESLKRMALRVGAKAYCCQQRLIMDRPDSRADLALIACPTLIICGRQDTLTPPVLSEEMAAGIAGAQLIFVEECNHYASMERPYAVSALLQQWLKYG